MTKSGIYLATVMAKTNPDKIELPRYPVWKKQVPGKDPNPEFFAHS